MDLHPGARFGSYQILSLLGRGGMGEVHRAHDTKLRRDVAIKVLPVALAADPERLERFQREARVLASLNDTHIGAIYGVEEIDSTVGLILELVEGDTLEERLLAARSPWKTRCRSRVRSRTLSRLRTRRASSTAT